MQTLGRDWQQQNCLFHLDKQWTEWPSMQSNSYARVAILLYTHTCIHECHLFGYSILFYVDAVFLAVAVIMVVFVVIINNCVAFGKKQIRCKFASGHWVCIQNHKVQIAFFHLVNAIKWDEGTTATKCKLLILIDESQQTYKPNDRIVFKVYAEKTHTQTELNRQEQLKFEIHRVLSTSLRFQWLGR